MNGTFAPKEKLRGSIMPDFIADNRNITCYEKMMFFELYRHKGSNACCWPSHELLACKLNCSVSSVKKHLKSLVELKLITIKRSSHIRSCVYFLHMPSDSADSQNLATTVEEGSQDLPVTPESIPVNSAYELNLKTLKSVKNLNPLLTPPSAIPASSAKAVVPHFLEGGFLSSTECQKAEQEFFKLWAMWPRKEAKTPAQREWLRLWFAGQLPPVEQILQQIEHLKAHNSHWQKKNSRYVPYLLTWLRDCRWLDEADTPDSAPDVQPFVRPEEVPLSREEIRAERAHCAEALKRFQEKQPWRFKKPQVETPRQTSPAPLSSAQGVAIFSASAPTFGADASNQLKRCDFQHFFSTECQKQVNFNENAKKFR